MDGKSQYNEACWSNHYLCEVCLSQEHGMKFFKKNNGKWEQVDYDKVEKEAEIAMEFCFKCNNAQRVHESLFFEEKAVFRPFEFRFWNWKDGTGFDEDKNEQLYQAIFSLQNKSRFLVKQYCRIITTVIHLQKESMVSELYAYSADLLNLIHAICSCVYGEKNPKIIYPYILVLEEVLDKVDKKIPMGILFETQIINYDLKHVLTQNQLDNANTNQILKFTLNESRASSKTLSLFWRLGDLLIEITKVPPGHQHQLFKFLNSIDNLFDALGDWLYGKGTIQKMKVRYKTFDFCSNLQQNPCFERIIKEAKEIKKEFKHVWDLTSEEV